MLLTGLLLPGRLRLRLSLLLELLLRLLRPFTVRIAVGRRFGQLLHDLGGTELFGRADTQENRARALHRVRPSDIQAVARRVFRPENLAVTVVGALSPTQARKVEKIVRDFR